MLTGYIYHDDRKSFQRWFQDQKRYATLEAKKLRTLSFSTQSAQDKVRSLVFFAPGIVILYCLFVKELIWEGPKGWYYVFQRMLAELLLSRELLKGKRVQ